MIRNAAPGVLINTSLQHLMLEIRKPNLVRKAVDEIFYVVNLLLAVGH